MQHIIYVTVSYWLHTAEDIICIQWHMNWHVKQHPMQGALLASTHAWCMKLTSERAVRMALACCCAAAAVAMPGGVTPRMTHLERSEGA
jgi:hypothetical protein